MLASEDIAAELQDGVREAAANGTALEILGTGDKRFLGRAPVGRSFEVARHRGVIGYEPTELVITARAGTRMAELEAVLAEAGQMLAFEPPVFSGEATVGGMLATGLSGPRRPYAGSVRDFVLGTRILNGRGQLLRFGGEVMKNVAGYDVSRLMAGAFGTLGVLLEVSLKVLPRPAETLTLAVPASEEEALTRMQHLPGRVAVLSGACFDGERLYARCCGSKAALVAAQATIGGDTLADAEAFWQAIRHHTHPFFGDGRPLWRISLPAGVPPLPISGRSLLDWGGAQRWLKSDETAEQIRRVVAAAGGHATLFRGPERESAVFHPLSEGLFRVHQNLKMAFDPHRIFNPGRLYQGL